MKKLIAILIISLGINFVHGQAHADFLVPSMTIGTGISDMNDVKKFSGFNYDIGYDFPYNPFGVTAFFSHNTIGELTYNEMPIYRDEIGNESVIVENKANFITWGAKLRYTPKALKYTRLSPYAELGIGLTHHRTNWNVKGLYDDVTDPDCPKYGFRDRGNILKSNTFTGVAELGVTYRVIGIQNDRRQMEANNNRAGWYLRASVRLEQGGKVSYSDPSSNPEQFYYNSGLGESHDFPNNNSTSRVDGGNFSQGRHGVLVFQLSLLNIML